MKILIAGGAGYIGSVLVPKLQTLGYKVNVLDLFWFGNHLPEETGVVHKDIFHVEESDVMGYDVVIFLAGLSNDPMAEFSPGMNFISNAAAPAYLAYTSKKAGVRKFIYAGSCSVYGYTVNEFFDEDSPTVSDYPYGISKLQGERAVMQLADYGFSAITLRQGTVCGYSPRMRLDLVVNTMFKTSVLGNQIIVNNPLIWRPVLAISDAVEAYIQSINADPDISGIFNVASGNYTVGEIAEYVKEEVGKIMKLDISINTKNIDDKRNYKVSCQRAKDILKFIPKNNIKTIVDNLHENMDRFRDFDNPNYYNIEVFKKLKVDLI
ncbi:MAG: SDR family oxidoreductase [Chlorobi bacterium]|nr:SDR family oxidoreductase [Chlorobiota bacterium]MCI0716543.1 SDR family oxidoreductase [Chlorobiota bacterium]